MTKTEIEWTDRVWNPVRGCSRVSEGCRHCYAEKFAHRFSGIGMPYEGLMNVHGKWNGSVNLMYDKLEDPLRWVKPSRIFVNSMSDLFHENVPDGFIGEVFEIMAQCPQHTFQILTKRALRMEQWFGSWASEEVADSAMQYDIHWPLPNVWMGVSVESQEWASDRIPSLLTIPAAVKFVSAEPLLDELDLTLVEDPTGGGYFNALQHGVDWVIAGCETGSRSERRTMKECWVRDLRLQCRSNDTAFFYKQAIDEKGKKVALPLLDGKRWNQIPQ